MSNLLLTFLNDIIPCQCLLCAASSKQPLCPACLNALPYWPAHSACPRCAALNTQGELCGACLKKPPAFEQTFALLLYLSPMAELIQAAKFGGRWALLPPLAALLAQRITPSVHAACMIALPLHPARLAERGFNQAQEIAAVLAKHWHIPLNTNLQRIRNTEHQARLSAKARLHNVRGAFVYHGDLSGKHIALVDDVMTSGASLNAAAKALKAAGAAHVQAWVIARTP